MTGYERAQRFIGVHEIAGNKDHPLIVWWLSLCGFDMASVHDETPWCSAFVNGMAWDVGLIRTKSALARSWLGAGVPIALSQAGPANDLVILQRGDGVQPGPENMTAPGHVGFFAGVEGSMVLVLGGNQTDGVRIARFPLTRVLGYRRLMPV